MSAANCHTLTYQAPPWPTYGSLVVLTIIRNTSLVIIVSYKNVLVYCPTYQWYIAIHISGILTYISVIYYLYISGILPYISVVYCPTYQWYIVLHINGILYIYQWYIALYISGILPYIHQIYISSGLYCPQYYIHPSISSILLYCYVHLFIRIPDTYFHQSHIALYISYTILLVIYCP